MIALLTDFGYKDPFVGIMKAVILSINPDAQIVDLSHGISAQNIKEASFVLKESFRYFPKKTIFLIVVDPGVGSQRRPILVDAQDRYFICPDNGIVSGVITEGFKAFHITKRKYFLFPVGTTFHGRDIFAPVAGWLSKGKRPSKFGGQIKDIVKIPLPEPQYKEGSLIGEVLYIDGFGNAITNLKGIPKGDIVFRKKKIPLVSFYKEAEDRGLSSVVSSSGLIELFIYGGSASSRYKIGVGEKVIIASK